MIKHIKFLFAIFIAIVSLALSSPSNAASNDSIYIRGRLKEALGKTDLLDGWAVILDHKGNPSDTVKTDQGHYYRDGEWQKMSYFGFIVPRTDSIYNIQVGCPKYTTKTFTFEVKDIGKRESSRSMPTVFLEKAPRQLDELTVTATKIKFYNKGDTIVYNADAFELAEGSMLDALIAQLPGVELKEGGQIMVNGEQVESLLLNGKEFFDNNNELMLENISAYSVKNVEVYKGYTPDEKWTRQTHGEKHLTMDVKLKREFNTGLTANAQLGYGTSDRYLGRLFGLWFNNTTRLTAIANFNNLNDTRKPGQKDSWKPEMMPSGTRKYQMAAFDYNYTDDEKKRFSGDITFTRNYTDNRTTTATTNFLAGGNTYDNSYSKSYNSNIRLSSYHYGSLRLNRWLPGYVVKAIYQDKDNESESLSGTFSEEQKDMTIDALKAIYSDGKPETLNSILNRASTRSDGRTKSGEIQFFPNVYYFLPKTNDDISNEFGIRYRRTKEDIWKDYTINYGNNPVPADVRRQYIDNTPHSYLGIQDNVTYNAPLGKFHLSLNYEYFFSNEIKDSYQYALERLEDAGIYGVLPAGWASTLDPKNSYTSRMISNTHTITPTINYSFNLGKDRKHRFYVDFSPSFAFKHSHLNYERNHKFHPVRKSFFLTTLGNWGARIDAYLDTKVNENRFMTYKHYVSLGMHLTPKAPNLFDMIEVTDDSNPLNIYMGNPDLKVEYTFRPSLTYSYIGPKTHPLSNHVSIEFSHVKNALTRGFTYDTSTGIRNSKMYNVDGNRSFNANNSFNLQFGSINQFTLTSNTNLNIGRYADMIGINMEQPELSKVDNNSISERLTFQWQIGKQSISLNGEFMNRHSFSDRPDFQTINANHYSYGIIANFKLPFNIGINTDFNIYTRKGYGVKELDTSDAIWNVRLTWTPPMAKQWTIMLDGFDMLHQLSNVNYAVTASGRTVSYSNALPRYFMASIQYRFQRQPKKR